jgi:hypothetical protein
VINAVVSKHPSVVNYIQGIHEVSAVLMMVLGEAGAYYALEVS